MSPLVPCECGHGLGQHSYITGECFDCECMSFAPDAPAIRLPDVPPGSYKAVLIPEDVDDRQIRQEREAEDAIQKDPTTADEAQPHGTVRSKGEEAGDTDATASTESTGRCRSIREEVKRIMGLWLSIKWEDFKSLFVRRKRQENWGGSKVVHLRMNAEWVPNPINSIVLGRPQTVQINRDHRVTQEAEHLHLLKLVAKQGGTDVVIAVDDPLELMHELAQGWFWMHEQDAATAKTPANEHNLEGSTRD